MTERLRSASVAAAGHPGPKMETDLSPRKTMLVLVIVVGCFAVLWPKVFYPMLLGSANQHMKPSPIDKATGCCDVIYEIDVNTIKIMSELCGTIVKKSEDEKLSGKELVNRCRQEVLETCGIDISSVLQEQARLGQNVKQILNEIRSLNGSLCLKYNYGVAPWKLGVPHRVTIKVEDEVANIRQERPHHLRSELIHPAFRERGRAIPQPQATPAVRASPRVVEGRPGPLPGMRPTLGGPGHVVPPPKQGTSSMSVIMPIYTIGIVIFFTYTLMKKFQIIFRKQPEGVGGTLYAPIDPDPHFRKEVFESESSRLAQKLTRESITSKLVVNAMSALLDEVDQEIEARRKGSETAAQDLANGTLSNGNAVKPQDEEQPTVKVLGMEMTASCEGGKKWSRPESPVLQSSPVPSLPEPISPPQEIYLEGALPAQSHLLVADSATESEPTTGEDPAVVLSGKMTLSVISLDSENGVEESPTTAEDAPLTTELMSIEDHKNTDVRESLQELELSEAEPPQSSIEKDIEEFLQKLRSESDAIQAPIITLESEDTPQSLEVQQLEQEVDNLILEAIDNIQRESQNILLNTNEINDDLNEPTIEENVQETRNATETPTAEIIDELNLPTKDQPINEDVPTENGNVQTVENGEKPIPCKDSEENNEIESNGHIIDAAIAPETFQIDQDEETQPTLLKFNEDAQQPISSDTNNLEKENIRLEDTIEPTQLSSSSETLQKTEPSNNGVENIKPNDHVEIHEEKPKVEDVPLSSNVEEDEEVEEEEEEEELASDEELVEEIEEVVYEEESEEDEEEDDIPEERTTNITESNSVRRVNGERSEDHAEESKYNTVSGTTAAENDISDEEMTDDDDEEIIEVEEIVDDDDYIVDEANDLNHISGESDLEL